MPFKIAFTLYILLSIFSSCNKNDTTPNNTIAGNDSIILSKIVGLDNSLGAPFDTVYVTKYNYDNMGRIIFVETLDYNNAGQFDTLNNVFETTSYQYNASDTVPYKQTTIFHNLNNEYEERHYYRYNTGTSLISYDSVIGQTTMPFNPTVSTIANEFHTNGTDIDHLIDNYFSGSADLITYSASRTNGNIVFQKGVASFGDSSFLSYTFDSKQNPFAKIGSWEMEYPGFIYEQRKLFAYGLPNSYRMKNNVTQIDLNDLGAAVPFHCEYQYSYNVNNYPDELTFRNPTPGYIRPNIKKIKFLYSR